MTQQVVRLQCTRGLKQSNETTLHQRKVSLLGLKTVNRVILILRNQLWINQMSLWKRKGNVACDIAVRKAMDGISRTIKFAKMKNNYP